MDLERKKTLALLAAALAGCATTPAQIRELGPRAEYQFQSDYRAVANCISRQYDEIFQALRTDVRDGEADIEILVRTTSATVSILSIKNTKPATAALYTTNGSLGSWVSYTDKAVANCQGIKR
jgi:hypothetical protein